MRPASIGTGVSIALALAVVLAACDSKPPTTPTPPGGGTPPPSPAVLSHIAIAGPATVAPGETAQFTATAHYSDVSTKNITSEPDIVWGTSNSRILAISPQGLATGGARGDVSVMASFGGRSSFKGDVIVLPSGTYRLAGTVTDTGFGVGGALVEVTDGPARGLVATASPDFRLYGVSGDTEIRVTKDGYHEARLRLLVTRHDQTANVELTPTSRIDVAGTYTLRFVAAEGCRAALPEEARARTYTAVLTQHGPGVTVTLEGAQFVGSGENLLNRFSGSIDMDRIGFMLMRLDPFYPYLPLPSPIVAEQLTTSAAFVPLGFALTTATSTRISGRLEGTIGTMELSQFRWIARCDSTDHQLVFSR